MQYIYQMDITKEADVAELSEQTDPFLKELVSRTMANRGQIDAFISRYAKGWELNRLAFIDRAILRIAICEFLYFDDIPSAVTMNEAVELSHLFGAEDSARFINGVLAGIAKGDQSEINLTQGDIRQD